jgi:hypothetical protein
VEVKATLVTVGIGFMHMGYDLIFIFDAHGDNCSCHARIGFMHIEIITHKCIRAEIGVLFWDLFVFGNKWMLYFHCTTTNYKHHTMNKESTFLVLPRG